MARSKLRFEHLTQRRAFELQEQFGACLPLRRIFAMALCREAQTAVIEEQPHELQYAREYELVYRHVQSSRTSATPTRIHFFKKRLQSVNEIGDDAGYLGYVDIRPIPPRTCCWAQLDEQLISGGRNSYLFVTCARQHDVELAGRRLRVRGFPYMQQDGLVTRCAQAALATIANYYGCELSGADFTTKTALDETAAKREIPSPGLTARQICLGIRMMNKHPFLLDYQQTGEADLGELRNPLEHIYPYVESGIPVLLGIKTARALHALVAIGHTFTPDSWMAESEHGYYNYPHSGTSSNWVRRIVVQDDNFGPYTLLPTEILRQVCSLISVPLPAHIYLMATDALLSVRTLLQKEFDELVGQCQERAGALPPGSDSRFWLERLRTAIKSDTVIMRPRLITGRDDLRRDIESLPPPVKLQLAAACEHIEWPEHVWKVELSWPEIFCHQRLCVGEVLLDASQPISYAVPVLNQAVFWIRFPGYVVYRRLGTTKYFVRVISDDPGIHQHFKRS